jgi:hypothetical protein
MFRFGAPQHCRTTILVHAFASLVGVKQSGRGKCVFKSAR